MWHISEQQDVSPTGNRWDRRSSSSGARLNEAYWRAAWSFVLQGSFSGNSLLLLTNFSKQFNMGGMIFKWNKKKNGVINLFFEFYCLTFPQCDLAKSFLKYLCRSQNFAPCRWKKSAQAIMYWRKIKVPCPYYKFPFLVLRWAESLPHSEIWLPFQNSIWL